MQAILTENNIQSKGKIVVPSMNALLKDLTLPASFYEQLEIYLGNNVRSVCAP